MAAARIAALSLALTSAAFAAVLPLPDAAFHDVIRLPLKGAGAPGAYSLVFLADGGLDAGTAAASICGKLEGNFEMGAYAGEPCREQLLPRVRRARGLAAQHPEGFAAAAAALESRLGAAGITAKDWGQGEREPRGRPARSGGYERRVCW